LAAAEVSHAVCPVCPTPPALRMSRKHGRCRAFERGFLEEKTRWL
jgi:hypothetical protein